MGELGRAEPKVTFSQFFDFRFGVNAGGLFNLPPTLGGFTAGGFHGGFAGHSSGRAFSAQTTVAEGFLASSIGLLIRSEADYPQLAPANNQSRLLPSARLIGNRNSRLSPRGDLDDLVDGKVVFMRSIKGSLVGLVLAGILAIAPTAAFAHGGGELPAFDAEKIDNRDFAIDTCYPTQNEIALAETRASRFWAKHSSRFGVEPRFLAVETSKIFPDEVQDLGAKLINSETTASAFSRGDDSYSDLQLLGVMIYDTKTGHFVSNQGYISVDTPPRGRVARFGPYIARYIGWG